VLNRRCDACRKETAFSSDGFCEECGRNAAASRIFLESQPLRISRFTDKASYLTGRFLVEVSAIFVLLTIVFAIGFFVWSNIGSPIWSDERTVYRATCFGSIISGECTSRSSPSPPITFKAIEAKQIIVYWTDDALPSRLESCVVRNQENWHCTINSRSGDFLYMKDGELLGSSDSLDIPKTIDAQIGIYQVPKWKWGLYKLRSYFIRTP
jgi:hypothetical protein